MSSSRASQRAVQRSVLDCASLREVTRLVGDEPDSPLAVSGSSSAPAEARICGRAAAQDKSGAGR